MSTLKVSAIQSPSTTDGGLAISSTGAVSGGLPYPNRNLIYNGAMQVAQRGTSTAGITTSGYYTADRWHTPAASVGTWTQSVENDAPTGSGFRKSIKMLCTTAAASLGVAAELGVQQRLEGQDLQRIAKGTADAKPLMASFWVKSNVTGTYYVWFADGDNSRHIGVPYTIDSSGTWEHKTVAVPADTTGVLDDDNGTSFTMRFYLAVGSAYGGGSTPATGWSPIADNNRAPGQTNLAAAVNNYWQVTGVQLETGPVATEFEHRSYGDELARCQRYYWQVSSGSEYTYAVVCSGWSSNAASIEGTIQLPNMRTIPSLYSSTGTGHYKYSIAGASANFTTLSITGSTSLFARVYNNTEISGRTAGQAGFIRLDNSAAYVAFSAEL